MKPRAPLAGHPGLEPGSRTSLQMNPVPLWQATHDLSRARGPRFR